MCEYLLASAYPTMDPCALRASEAMLPYQP